MIRSLNDQIPPTWWDAHPEALGTKWEHQLGDEQAMTRKILRGMIVDAGYATVLDVGCGPAIDARPLRNLGVNYSGVDASERLVDRCLERGIFAQLGRAEALPIGDRVYDLAYCRHVIEYAGADGPGAILNQMIRVARRAVVVILGESPGLEDRPAVEGREPAWRCWGRTTYEAVLRGQERVDRFWWMLNIGRADAGGPPGGAGAGAGEGIGGVREAMLVVELG